VFARWRRGSATLRSRRTSKAFANFYISDARWIFEALKEHATAKAWCHRARSLADSVIEREPGQCSRPSVARRSLILALPSDLSFADCDAEASEARFAQERAVRARIGGVDTLDADRIDERAFYDEEDADIQGACKSRIKSLDVRRRRATAFPDDPDALFQLADGYLRFGRFERSIPVNATGARLRRALGEGEP
jgi:hypothetical protein